MKNCKRCGSPRSMVTETRIHDALPIRRRTCLDCNYKWKTIELEYWEYVDLIKEKR